MRSAKAIHARPTTARPAIRATAIRSICSGDSCQVRLLTAPTVGGGCKDATNDSGRACKDAVKSTRAAGGLRTRIDPAMAILDLDMQARSYQRRLDVHGPRTALGYVIAVLGTAAATLGLLEVRPDVSKTNVVLTFLAVVVAAAATGGLGPGAIAAVAGFLA